MIRSLTTLVAGSMPALIYRPSLRRGGEKMELERSSAKYAATVAKRRQDKPLCARIRRILV